MHKICNTITTILVLISCFACNKQETDYDFIVKHFPYDPERIISFQEMTLFVASEKRNPYTDIQMSEEEIYANHFCYIIKYAEYLDWEFCHWALFNFPYEKGYEYEIKGILVNYYGNINLESLFICREIIDAQKKTSIDLPTPV